MIIRQQHYLPKSQAMDKASILLPDLLRRYKTHIAEASYAWDADVLAFSFRTRGFNIKGRVQFIDEEIIFDVDIPLALRPLGGRIRSAAVGAINEAYPEHVQEPQHGVGAPLDGGYQEQVPEPGSRMESPQSVEPSDPYFRSGPGGLGSEGHPVTVNVIHPDSYSRWSLLLRVMLLRPSTLVLHSIPLYFYGIAAVIVTFFAFWIILFTRKYPQGMFEFVVGFVRWQTRVTFYLFLLRDEYPPFNGKP